MTTAAAIEAVAALSPEIPFWPQLPRLSDAEQAVAQGLSVLSGLIEPRLYGYGYRVKEGRIDSALERLHRSDGELMAVNASGFGALEEGLARGFFPFATAVKGQIEGPVTLAACLFYKDRPFLADPALFSAIAFHVSQMICWQVDRLKATGRPVLLFVDEPALCLETPSAVSEEKRLNALAVTLDDARARGAVAGLHCCAARPFTRMCRAKPDILSFDAHEWLEAFFADRDALAFARGGGTVAYGLIPTWNRLNPLDPVQVFTRWLTAASLAGDPQELAQRTIITATCGLGLVEPSSVGESFNAARGVGRLIRRLAGS
jgi:hypothetical protein